MLLHARGAAINRMRGAVPVQSMHRLASIATEAISCIPIAHRLSRSIHVASGLGAAGRYQCMAYSSRVQMGRSAGSRSTSTSTSISITRHASFSSSSAPTSQVRSAHLLDLVLQRVCCPHSLHVIGDCLCLQALQDIVLMQNNVLGHLQRHSHHYYSVSECTSVSSVCSGTQHTRLLHSSGGARMLPCDCHRWPSCSIRRADSNYSVTLPSGSQPTASC